MLLFVLKGNTVFFLRNLFFGREASGCSGAKYNTFIFSSATYLLGRKIFIGYDFPVCPKEKNQFYLKSGLFSAARSLFVLSVKKKITLRTIKLFVCRDAPVCPKQKQSSHLENLLFFAAKSLFVLSRKLFFSKLIFAAVKFLFVPSGK